MFTPWRPFRGPLLVASTLLLATAQAGCEDEPETKGAQSAADAVELKRIEEGKKLLNDAKEAIQAKKYPKARKALMAAAKVDVESQRFEVKDTLARLDALEAKDWSSDVVAGLGQKDCTTGFQTVAEAFKTVGTSDAFVKALRHAAVNEAKACIDQTVDKKLRAGAYASARETLGAPHVKTFFGPGWEKMSGALEATILEGLTAKVDREIKMRRQAQAIEKIEGFRKSGDATPDQVIVLLNLVREGMASALETQAARAIGQKDAAAQLQKLDDAIKALKWDIVDPDDAKPAPDKAPKAGSDKGAKAGSDKGAKPADTEAAGDTEDDGAKEAPKPKAGKEAGKASGDGSAKGDAAADKESPAASKPTLDNTLPPGLAEKRRQLVIWVLAQQQGFKPITRAKVSFTHGKVPVQPPTKFDGEAQDSLENSTKVWVIGTAKDKALVTTEDPKSAKLSNVLAKVAGWVPVSRLVGEDTTNWLPPEAELVGFRVWAPLDPPDDVMSLGTVAEISPAEVTVAKLSDGAKVKVKREQIRAGRLPAGTRVITFCLAKGQPAKVVEMAPSGQSAKLKCDGGQEKEEDLSALHSKADMLPPRK